MKASAKPGSTVLVIDDDVVDREFVHRALEAADDRLEIVEAENGVEALDLIHGSARRPPLTPPLAILLDLNMPRMNGFEFLAALRADPAHAATPVFVLTTSSALVDRERAEALGITGYVVKSRARDAVNAVVGILAA